MKSYLSTLSFLILGITLAPSSSEARFLKCEEVAASRQVYTMELEELDGNEILLLFGRNGKLFRILLLGAVDRNKIAQPIIEGSVMTHDAWPTKERFEIRLPMDLSKMARLHLKRGEDTLLVLPNLKCRGAHIGNRH